MWLNDDKALGFNSPCDSINLTLRQVCKLANKQNKLYSETMRELSLLDEESLKLYAMRWNLMDTDPTLVNKVGLVAFESIGSPTAVQRNALLQILASFEDSIERKEWADRIEGKATQTTMNINHDTKEDINTLKDYTREKLDELFNGME